MIRHALSEWNVEGRWQGHADPPLSAQGVAQARAAAAAVGPVGLVISSDLERARRTATLLAPGARHVTEPGLREFDVGVWSGRTRAEIETEWGAELTLFDQGRLESPPGGERRADFDTRVRAAANRVSQLVSASGEVRALVVSHGGVLRALARMQAWADRHVGHLSGYEAEVKEVGLVLLQPVDLLSAAPAGHEPGARTVF